jgi:hypothetical protein
VTDPSSPLSAADIDALYERQLADRRAVLARHERLHARVSYIRLAIAASAVVILIAGGLAALAWLLVPLAAFVIVAVIHGRVLNARDRAASAVAFYERGLARIRDEWIGHGRTGEAYRPADHPFVDDLDIFGRGSLFELLATTRTHAGEEALVQAMLTPIAGDEARSRQGAVRELAGRLDLREAVAVLGDQVRVAVDAPVLRAWARSPQQLSSAAMRVQQFALASASVGLLIWWSRTGALSRLTLAVILVQCVVAWTLRSRVAEVVEAIDEPAHDLDVLADLLRILERERFDSPRLDRLRLTLGGAQPASQEIARLARLVALLESRHNILFAIPASVMLWTSQWAFAIEAWRRRTGVHIPAWLDAVGELEALIAVGGFAAEHPGHAYPEIADGPPLLTATALAHPTMGRSAVANDLALGGDGLRLLVVSGSNMSGKSTWLRTVGSTVVLSWLGAPVRAQACRLSSLGIGASIRVQDSLADGRSRFFAEILRLKQIIDLAQSTGGHLLFLLDEILSGTNSHDRRAGAEALLTGLVTRGAIGMVTTHDLALGAIAERVSGPAANAHFADIFADGTLTFDYRLKPGVVETSNALALMRSIGLDV